MDILFSITFYLAAPFWALMILAPHWSWTRRIAGSPWIITPPLLIYAVAVLGDFGTVLPAVARPTYAEVGDLLADGNGTTAAWAHFIAFDLFVGRWAYLESRKRGIPALLMAPILVLTILLGPLGMLVFLAVRRFFPVKAGAAEQSAVPTA